MGNSYRKCMEFLKYGKKALFSGTPCQVAGLKNFFNATNTGISNLLTVEVICEGVPSPLYMRKYGEFFEKNFGRKIISIDYRYTGKSLFKFGKWDFEIMKIKLNNDSKEIIVDRWFNPFWFIWLNHLMSRPLCYVCHFARQERVADISLGDLWGVHIYCPELYGNNGGASLIVANSKKVKIAQEYMYGHELEFEGALKYQSPMHKHIDSNPKRVKFMMDLKSDMCYEDINKKWVKKPNIKLLWQKYIWGNRQKVAVWNLKRKIMNK